MGRLFIISIAFTVFISIVSAETVCVSNEDCKDSGLYCYKTINDCDGIGQCQLKPEICPDIWAPVCGCDGKTYGNECEAAAAGVNIEYLGECSYCLDNSGCGLLEYCLKESCDAEIGSCNPRPEICPDIWMPVCGCDGKTYGNECEAAAAGVSVNHKGECYVQNSCNSTHDCSAVEYCKFENCDDLKGNCTTRPDACPDVWAPVCGCDGKTYGNSCVAAAAGVSIDYEGECITQNICSSNDDCVQGQYCMKDNCDDPEGSCSQRPEACPDVWAPVCGCDGKTYGNSCEAAAAGVNIDYEGACSLIGSCTDNSDCSPDDFCLKESCDAPEGTCVPRPEACLALYDPVCGCDGKTYGNSCNAAQAGVNIRSSGQCPPPGPHVLMREPKVMSDDVHTGQNGVPFEKILWTEAVTFTAADITIVDENGDSVPFTASGSTTSLMHIKFANLLYNRYEIRISDSVVSTATGRPIDGDNNGFAGGDALIVMEHRKRADLNNDNQINFLDLVRFAEEWLWQI